MCVVLHLVTWGGLVAKESRQTAEIATVFVIVADSQAVVPCDSLKGGLP